MGIKAACSLALLSLWLAAPAFAFFRLPCGNVLEVARMDPVVNPNAISGHVHTIMGGSNFNFATSFEELRQSQCSSCAVREDLSNYWTPNLYFQWANGSFTSVPQIGGMTAYYLQRQANKTERVMAFPPGFRMLAGTPSLRTYNGSNLAQQAISFVCLDYNGPTGSVPQTPYLPTQDCYSGLRAQVFFPSCHDGVNLDSPNHKSHVAYPSGMDNGKCPPGYPVRLMSLFYEVTFNIHAFGHVRDQAMNTTQPFVFSNGDPTGYGFHGDFINGWDVDVLQKAADDCRDDSGVIEKCPYFTYFDKDSTCRRSPDVNEQVFGTMDKLPGCNPVTYSAAPTCADPSPPSKLTGIPYTTKAPPANATIPPGYPKLASGSSGYDYVSCFSDVGDNGNSRALTNALTVTGDMTVDKCLAACKSRNYQYCGLENGRECYGSDTLAAAASDVGSGMCGMTCQGDGGSYCGDSRFLTTYRLAKWVPTTTTNPGPKGASFLGCYVDNNGGRALAKQINLSNTTVATCVSACAAGGYSLAGVEYARECFCDNSVRGNNTVASPPSDPVAAGCKTPCQGNASEYCGGGSRLNVYRITAKSTKVKREWFA